MDNGIPSTIELLRSNLIPNNDSSDLVVNISAQFNDLEKEIALGTISFEQNKLTLSKITGSLIYVINCLRISELNSSLKFEKRDDESVDLSKKVKFDTNIISLEEAKIDLKIHHSRFNNELGIFADIIIFKHKESSEALKVLKSDSGQEQILKGTIVFLNIFAVYAKKIKASSLRLYSLSDIFIDSFLIHFQALYADKNKLDLEKIAELKLFIHRGIESLRKIREDFKTETEKGIKLLTHPDMSEEHIIVVSEVNQVHSSIVNILSQFIGSWMNFEDGFNRILLESDKYNPKMD